MENETKTREQLEEELRQRMQGAEYLQEVATPGAVTKVTSDHD